MSLVQLSITGFTAGCGFAALVAALMSSYYALARGCDGV